MSLNVVTLVGRVGGEPEVRYFDSGAVKCRLTMAVNRPVRNSDQPDWFTLELWGKEAQFAADYIHKGRLIGVKGSLKIDTWVSSAGENRSTPIIKVDRIETLDSKKDAAAGQDGGYSEHEEF